MIRDHERPLGRFKQVVIASQTGSRRITVELDKGRLERTLRALFRALLAVFL